MSERSLDHALDGVARPLRGSSGLARVFAGAAAALVVLAAMAWLVRLGLSSAPTWILGGWLVVVVLLGAGLFGARRAIDALGPWHVAERLENSGAWRRGALTTVLDPAAAGTSAALHAAASHLQAVDVERRAADALAPLVSLQLKRTRVATGVALGGLIALVAAGPLRGATASIWHPVRAWNALTAPVRLHARSESVARGERAVFDLTAYAQQHAVLLTRSPGERWQSHPVQLDADGRATFTTPPLSAELVARLEAGGRTSDEVHVGVRLPAFLGAFSVVAHYPAYLKLESEAMPTGGDTLVVPEGTRLALSGRATTGLASAAFVGPDGVRTLPVSDATFRGDIVPVVSGLWRLQVAATNGSDLEGGALQMPIILLPDSAPAIDVPVPGADTVASSPVEFPLVVSAKDDHGLRALHLEVRRGALGTVVRLPLAADGGDRALVTIALDFATLGASPGDTLRYVAVAVDNAPAAHTGRSREYLVRIPTEREQRAARADATADATAGLDSVTAAAKRAQRQAEDLARERQRSDGRGGSDGERKPMSLESARKAEAAAQAQEKVLAQTAEVAKQVEALRQQAERAGLADSALARQLGEIQQLLDRAMTPELRAKLDALREAVKDLDADRTRDALQDLAKKQAELKDALEQARELLKRAALEADLANLAQEAGQLAGEQARTTEKLAQSDSGKSAAAEEQALSARVDSLAAALDRAAQKVPSEATRQGLRQAGDRARQASAKMQQAAKSAQQGNSQDAKEQGKDAEAQLDPLADQINEERQQMQQEMRQEVLDALERTLAETSRLAQRQVVLAESFRRGALVSQSRIDQGTVEEGAGKLMQQVTELAAKNALVSPQAGVALAAARQSMRGAVDAVSTASPNLRDAADQAGDAVDALAVAAFHLLRAKDRIGGSQSGSGLQEAMEQMQQMAGKQGELSQQANGMLSQGQGGSQQQLMQMAMQQRAIAQQMERMRAGGQSPGAGEMAREAKELSRTLEAGRLDRETADRQERLFKKMLDAGRALQGEEKDETKERQSTAAKDAALRTPDALDPRMRGSELRLPGWEELQRLSPEERRRVMDYFRRLAGGAP